MIEADPGLEEVDEDIEGKWAALGSKRGEAAEGGERIRPE